jgi:poly-gamma-glutamate synthesis protein (capsule biosynthesis protein)
VTLEITLTGDLILGADDVRPHLASAAPLLRDSLAVGHLEWPHTDRGAISSGDLPAPAAPLANLDALADAGFDVLTMAGNHIFDQGPAGIADTLERLDRLGVAATGAGATLEEARRPAIVERDGIRVGVLSYNAVGPRESWATASKAGAAYVRVHAVYDLEMASPGSPPTEYTYLEPVALAAMEDDIRALRPQVDVLVVALHKGMVFVRADLAMYERPLARAAIDAGADIVASHHAHIMRGVEVYRGRPIFHGLNHFVTAYQPTADPTSPRSRARTRPARSPILRLVEPDRSVRDFPFSRDSRMVMLGSVQVDRSGVRSAGFYPCWIDESAHTIVHGDDEVGREVARYAQAISDEAGLQADIRGAGSRFHFLS